MELFAPYSFIYIGIFLHRKFIRQITIEHQKDSLHKPFTNDLNNDTQKSLHNISIGTYRHKTRDKQIMLYLDLL